MIVRIMGEAQREVPDTALDALNALDEVAERAVDAGDEAAFTATLAALLQAVRERGTVLTDDVLVASDLVLPPAHATVEQVRHYFDGDGLVPG